MIHAMSSGGLTIGQLARVAGVGIETVRFYERRGLIRQPPKPPGSVRRYGTATAARIVAVKRAQELGFTLDEVAGLLALEAADCEQAADIASVKLAAVDSRIAELTRMRGALERLLYSCAAKPEFGCPIVATLLAAPADKSE